MHIIHLTPATIEAGEFSYNSYRAALMCGPLADVHAKGLRRQTGLTIVPGAIVACIKNGMMTEDEIVNAVARLSRCKRSTVQKVLVGLSGEDPEHYLWCCDQRGDFRLIAHGRAKLMLAA